MSTPAIVMMVLVGGMVWGGFLFLLGGGVLAEGKKEREGSARQRQEDSP